MKIKQFIRFGAVAGCTALAFLSTAALVPAQGSNQQESSEDDQASATITVIVPAGGAVVTYTVDGTLFTVYAGSRVVLPAAARNIHLPAETLVETSRTGRDGGTTVANFKISTPVTLARITQRAVKHAASSFTLETLTRIRPDGTKREFDAVTGEVTVTDPSGNVVSTTTSVAAERSTGEKALTQVAATVRATSSNTNTILGVPSTDGNTASD